MLENKRTITIGIMSDGYPEKRNIIDLPYSEKIIFKKKIDLLKPYNYYLFKVRNKINPNTTYRFIDINFKGDIDLFHFFSGIYQGHKPWVVTTDVILPRWTKNIKNGVKLLAQNNCKKIIFLSQIMYEKQINFLNDFPAYKDKIISKMIVLPSSQKILSIPKKITCQKINFILVGHRILGKGGYEIIKVFDKLSNEYNNFKLTVVSKLHVANYLKNNFTDERLDFIKDTLINIRPNYLQYYESLPNEKVKQLLRNSDVALLPSYDDTFGYFVLESQASGCPIITTDIFAFPEINNDSIGWIINVPKLEFGKPDAFTNETYLNFSNQLETKLYDVVKSILQNPESIQNKSNNAIEQITKNFSPKSRADYQLNLYKSIIDDI